MSHSNTPEGVVSSEGLGLVVTDAAGVRRELMALARRDVITHRDRITIGAAISLIGKELERLAELQELSERDCPTCRHNTKGGIGCERPNCHGRIDWQPLVLKA